MDEPILTMEERKAINEGRWFSSLSPTLRHDILRCAQVKRFQDGELIAARGDPADQWIGCARGAVRISSTSLTGKLITFDYVQPGIWFGNMAMVGSEHRTHDLIAHGETTVLTVMRQDFERILTQHPEFSLALLKLEARRVRLLSHAVEDLALLPLRARLAKQVYRLARNYGTPAHAPGELRITLQLAQEELAQMLGASRQRVNQELKAMEREGVLRVEPNGLVVCDQDALLRIGDAPDD
ncbi:MAG: Crp/Fnr family transcriptional regulator [Burkholderiaceae bacterium]|jgi:CRP-like cAMP-binding protein|nr:Crp/Fnr family transcriptional regulator [Burkholderiaceae bacterium]